METFEAIETRRSVKHFDPSHDMPEEDLKKLLKAAMLSPTSFNIQNWRFVVVRDAEKRAAIRAAAWNQAQVTDASALLLICADLQAFDKEPERYWRNAPEPVKAALVPMIGKFYANNPQLQRDEGIRSVGIASQTLMLAARAMGYDSNPIIGFDPGKVAEIINLPENHIIGLMLAVGKPLNPALPRGGQLDYAEVCFENGFPG